MRKIVLYVVFGLSVFFVQSQTTAIFQPDTRVWSGGYAKRFEHIIPKKDYEIDVTVFVRFFVENPEENFGFMMHLVDPKPYRAIIFYSSRYNNPEKRPKLVVVYEHTETKKAVQTYISKIGEPFRKVEVSGLKKLIVIDENLNIIMEIENFDISLLDDVVNSIEKGCYMFQLLYLDGKMDHFKIEK